MPRPVPQVTIYQPRWAEDDYLRRPVDFDPDLADAIILRVMNGETLNALCSNNRDYPLPGTFLLWMEQEPAYNLKYRKAKSIQTELLVDGIIEDGKAGTWDASTRVQAGKIYAEKTDPMRYGSRATITTVQREEEPVQVDHTAELRRRIKAMADRAKAQEEAERES